MVASRESQSGLGVRRTRLYRRACFEQSVPNPRIPSSRRIQRRCVFGVQCEREQNNVSEFTCYEGDVLIFILFLCNVYFSKVMRTRRCKLSTYVETGTSGKIECDSMRRETRSPLEIIFCARGNVICLSLWWRCLLCFCCNVKNVVNRQD